jgi:predicted RNA-binding Zn-ribbon protein involved in translation (DUF1610 family)
MTTVRICPTLPEAQVVQSQLAGSGIRAFLPDEFTVQNDWMLTNAIGGVRVQVLEADAERAAEILGDGLDEKKAALVCPNCGTPLQEHYGFGLYPRIFLTLLLSIPFRSKPSLKCPACGTTIAAPDPRADAAIKHGPPKA